MVRNLQHIFSQSLCHIEYNNYCETLNKCYSFWNHINVNHWKAVNPQKFFFFFAMMGFFCRATNRGNWMNVEVVFLCVLLISFRWHLSEISNLHSSGIPTDLFVSHLYCGILKNLSFYSCALHAFLFLAIMICKTRRRCSKGWELWSRTDDF